MASLVRACHVAVCIETEVKVSENSICSHVENELGLELQEVVGRALQEYLPSKCCEQGPEVF